MTARLRAESAKISCSLVLLAAAAVALPGCNTIEGAGEDIKATGGAISDTARDTKEEITD